MGRQVARVEVHWIAILDPFSWIARSAAAGSAMALRSPRDALDADRSRFSRDAAVTFRLRDNKRRCGDRRMSRSYRRLEALPLGWEALSDSQRDAVSSVASWLIDAIAAIPRARGESRGAPHQAPQLDRNRFSQIAFIDGDRGTGKSSVLLTLMDLTSAESFPLPKGLADDHPVRLLREQRRRLVWLETLDMEPLSRGANLFAAILARIAQVFDGKLEDLPPIAAALGDPDGAADVAERFQQLQNDAAIVWERLDGGSQAGDPQTRALWVNQAERAGLDLNRRIGKVLDGVARTLGGRHGEDPMLVLPVDDFDLAPAHCLELLRLIRMIATPRLFFVVAGNIRIAESVLKLRSAGELARLAGFKKAYADEARERALEIAANNMRKLVPPGQRARLAELRLSQALSIGRDTDDKSLKERLEMLTFEANQAPTGAATLSLAKFLLLDDPAVSNGTSRIWLAGTPRQVLDCREMLARIEDAAIEKETKDERDDRLVGGVLEEIRRQILEDWRLSDDLRDRLAEVIDPSISISLDLEHYLRVERERAYAPQDLGESDPDYPVARQLSSDPGESRPDRSSSQPSTTAREGFDCFLLHNGKDKSAVRALAEALRARGLSVWRDEEQLRPGSPSRRFLESGMRTSRSVAALVGADGLGPWEREEMQFLLLLAIKDGRPVIPVLLPDAPAAPEMPSFLLNRTWVDLRSDSDPESAFDRLVWGISGGLSDGVSLTSQPQVTDRTDNRALVGRKNQDGEFQYGTLISYPSLSTHVYVETPNRESRIELTRRLGAGLVFAHDLAASVWGGYLRHSPLTYRFNVAPLVGARWEKRPDKDLLVVWTTPEWWTFRDYERFTGHWSLHLGQCEGQYGLAWMASILEVILDEPCKTGATGLTVKRLTGFLNRLAREHPNRTARRVLRQSALEAIARLLAPESVAGIEQSPFMVHKVGFRQAVLESDIGIRIREARARLLQMPLDTPQAAALYGTIAPQRSWTRVRAMLPDVWSDLRRHYPSGDYPPTFPPKLVAEICAISKNKAKEAGSDDDPAERPQSSPTADISRVVGMFKSGPAFGLRDATRRELARRESVRLDVLLALAQAASKDHPFNTLADGAFVPTEEDIKRLA